MKSLRA